VTANQKNQFDQRLATAKASLAAGDLAGAKNDLAALKTEFEQKNADCLTRMENGTNTHLAARHGADVTPVQLKTRLTTGVTPDGAVAPNEYCTKFFSYDEMLSTLADALSTYGLRLDQINVPIPAPLIREPAPVTRGHGRDVGEGYRGVSPAGQVRCKYSNGTPQNNPDGSPKNKDVYAISFFEKFQRTFTRIEWRAGAWKVTQHFPTA